MKNQHPFLRTPKNETNAKCDNTISTAHLRAFFHHLVYQKNCVSDSEPKRNNNEASYIRIDQENSLSVANP